MTQEEKSILLQDLCARLPYGVKVKDELGRINKLVIGNADLVRLYYNDFSIYGEKALSLPLLRPMSSMTEEEIHDTIGFPRKISIGTLKGWVDYTISNPDFVDWLNARHFDYRGLIEKGLAIEAPEGMYEY